MSQPVLCPRKDALANMWNRLMDRIAPMMDEDLSPLDLADGIGQRVAEPDVSAPVVAVPTSA